MTGSDLDSKKRNAKNQRAQCSLVFIDSEEMLSLTSWKDRT